MGKWRYGVIVDAGSSGSRAYVYRWLSAQKAKSEADGTLLSSLPALQTKKKWAKKVHPGVSTFGETPELVGPDHLAGLVEHALKYVPSDQVPNTPIFLLATAGVRLLPDHQRSALLSNICRYFQSNTRFQLPDCDLHIQAITGETEGLYGWIAANYLLGGFDAPADHNHGKGHHTYGFLDMGGASAQIAFAPNATEAEKHANDLILLRMRTVGGQQMEYKVFVTTWLGFGANEARRRYVEALMEESPGSLELPDPCLPAGLKLTKSGDIILPGSSEANGDESHMLGTGVFTECLKRTYPLLEKDAPCEDEPCLLNGIHVPAIDFDVNHFVGVSEYWHTTHGVFQMAHKDKAYDFNTYQHRVEEFCSQNWKTISKEVEDKKWGKKVDETTALEVCFKASWLINMLHDGIGIPRTGIEPTKPADGHYTNGTKAILEGAKSKGFLESFQAVDKIDDTEVSWTLGKMVLYASSQSPPLEEGKAVGFGSNVAGTALPKDFQYAGSDYKPLPAGVDDAETSDWHDTLFTSSSARRVPGLLLFMLILVLAAFLLCGRERRNSLYNRIRTMLGKDPYHPARSAKGRRKGLFGGTRGPSYERVLENGDPDEVELGEVHEDSDSDVDVSTVNSLNPRAGLTSGLATPKLGYESPTLHSSPNRGKPTTYFDSIPPSQGIPPVSAFEWGGLSARTESRERLAAAQGLGPNASGSRSRHASPTRRSPLPTSFKTVRD